MGHRRLAAPAIIERRMGLAMVRASGCGRVAPHCDHGGGRGRGGRVVTRADGQGLSLRILGTGCSHQTPRLDVEQDLCNPAVALMFWPHSIGVAAR